VVDLDPEKFFDRVNHEKLIEKITERVSDEHMLKLIRACPTAGVMEHGLVGSVDEGTPQGGPLSPLLSNIVLDEMDLDVERRGLRFVRYAEIAIYMYAAGERRSESWTASRDSSRRSSSQGKSAEECGGAAMGAEVSRIPFHERRRTKTADCAESGGPVQEAGPGTGEPDARK
jgi:retron-type reverse transcriptase